MDELPQLRERALSSMQYHEYKKIRVNTSSPEIRPLDTLDVPPPISLTPAEINSYCPSIEKLRKEKEEDQHLIRILQSHSLQQVKELAELQAKYEDLTKELEEMSSKLRDVNHPSRGFNLLQQAVLARSRSSSIAGNS